MSLRFNAMSFELTVLRQDKDPLNISVDIAEILFILGANGTGKSSLMQQFQAQHRETALRMSAHRQTWFGSEAINVTPEQRRNYRSEIQGYDAAPDSRWRDSYSSQRPNISIYNLVEAENVRAREIAKAVDSGDTAQLEALKKTEAPIKIINELLKVSNLDIEISISKDDQVLASKSGSNPYTIAYLSDGERNALLVAAEVLTLPPGTLVLIDEPERHLHRSIISPLLTSLFQKRRDCAFVVSTHEVMLPFENPSARTLLLRGITYSGGLVSGWEADLLSAYVDIGEDTRRDILGARSKVLFIEGDEGSLDKSLYGLVFPNVTVIPKSGSRDVETSVMGIRDATDLHWLSVFGIVDNDGRSQSKVDDLLTKGIYALSVFSVESIYYHPEIQRRVTERHTTVTGGDVSSLIHSAKSAAVSRVAAQIQRLSERAIEKRVREAFFSQLPRRSDFSAGTPISISVDIPAEVARERKRLEDSIREENLEEIIERYPVRETGALADIARELRFANREQYEAAVRKLLTDDQTSLTFVRSFFGNLPNDIGVA